MNTKQPSTQRANSKMRYRVGIDTGGTFTDIVLVDDATGAVETAKVESTLSDPGLAALKGLRQLGKPPESIASIVLGTTITTNAVLQLGERALSTLQLKALKVCHIYNVQTSPIRMICNTKISRRGGSPQNRAGAKGGRCGAPSRWYGGCR
jgi:hypothetical protein